MENNISVLIGGDMVPTVSNSELFRGAKLAELFGEDLINLLQKADFRVFNLEVPLVDVEAPIKKNGPHLMAPTSTVCGIKQIETDLLTLANNHVLDQGEQGLYSTIEILEKNNIGYVGAGSNLCTAAQAYIWEKNSIKIGFYACAEREFSIATENSAGANPFDPLESLEQIANLKNKCDYVIVLHHGGKEHYRYPSPELRRICRKVADKGADLVVCQHSHCIGAFEKYDQSTIVYGQGNFIFDGSESDFWKTALLIKVDINAKGMAVDYVPIVKYRNCVRLAEQSSTDEILLAFNDRSQKITDDAFIKNEYEKFAAQKLNGYLAAFRGNSLFLRVIKRLGGHIFLAKPYSNRALLSLQNYIEAEAHRELILQGLRDKQRNNLKD